MIETHKFKATDIYFPQNNHEMHTWQYSFFIAAITNYHKFTGLKTTQICYSSGGQKADMGLTGLKSRHWQGCVPFWKHWGESVSLSFNFQLLPTFLDSWPPSSKLITLCNSDQSSIVISLSDRNQERFSNFKDSCDQIGPLG